MRTTTRYVLAALSAFVIALTTGIGPAAAITGADICGSGTYEHIHTFDFANGKAVLTKHKNSTTWCGTVIADNTSTAKSMSVTITRIAPEPTGYGRKSQSGTFHTYAGPVYLANPVPARTDFYIEGHIGSHHVQGICAGVPYSCGIVFKD